MPSRPRRRSSDRVAASDSPKASSILTLPRTAIVSDLHGNVPALDICLNDAAERGVERYVCLGDMVGYGARPRDCVERLMRLIEEGDGRKAGRCLQGNHEFALLNSAEDFNPSARQAIEWTRECFNGSEDPDRDLEIWDFLSGLEPSGVEGKVMFAHGSPRDPVREYLLPRDARDPEKMRAVFACMDARICFVGHSHVPAIYYEDGRFYRPKDTEGPYDLAELSETRAIVNVGSVGQPRDGDKRLSYVIFDGDTLTFVRLDYDVEAAQSEIRAVPELPDYLADRLGEGR